MDNSNSTFDFPIMSDREALRFIEAHKWKFASTMPWAPHWYIVLAYMPDDSGRFHEFAQKIFHEGKLMTWKSQRPRYYLDLGDYRYWSMDPTWESTDLINREKIEGSVCVPV